MSTRYLSGTSWQQHISAAIELRHYLHQRPELTWQEHATAETIRTVLTELSVNWRACAETGTVATIAADAPGKHVALRADIDALPIVETADVPWVSETKGCMHACGHDGHTAVVMAAVSWLSQHENRLPGPVSFLFQPAEEGGHGARAMIEDGALDGVGCGRPVEVIYGWHNWPVIPLGRAACPDGVIMAANGTFSITIKGKGGHSSQPELCRDPLLASAALIMNLQQIVSRRIAPQRSAVLSVTSCDALSAPTVIPEKVRLEGSIRVENDADRDYIFSLIQEIAEETAVSYGTTAVTELVPRYGATTNHSGPAEACRIALAEEFGAEWDKMDLLLPVMASEDFSYYLQQIPGAFMLVGASEGDRFSSVCHSPNYAFNDNLIERLVRVYSHLAGLGLQ